MNGEKPMTPTELETIEDAIEYLKMLMQEWGWKDEATEKSRREVVDLMRTYKAMVEIMSKYAKKDG